MHCSIPRHGCSHLRTHGHRIAERSRSHAHVCHAAHARTQPTHDARHASEGQARARVSGCSD
eukprot:8334891-Lingulodinium_polyedra.AAC.1